MFKFKNVIVLHVKQQKFEENKRLDIPTKNILISVNRFSEDLYYKKLRNFNLNK